MFALSNIEYPAYIVVYGPSKHYISTYNRSEYDEYFTSEVCYSEGAARRLFEGYQGREQDLKVYAIPKPIKVIDVASGYNEYEQESFSAF